MDVFLMQINGPIGFFSELWIRTFSAGASREDGAATMSGAGELLCCKCPVGNGALCGALIRGAKQVPKEGHVRQTAYGAAENAIIYSKKTTPGDVFAVCQGWALRFVELADGRRQNLAVLLPGDICVAALFEDELHFSVQAVTKVRIARFARADLTKRILSDAHTLELYGKACAAELRDIDERAVDLGRRSAEERVSHLILGILHRVSEHRVLPNHPYAFPLLQRHIADLTGLTPVHVSRVMTEFRNAGLMRLTKRSLTITNLMKLEQIAQLK
jgi:CRP/FNR family transcriptional regulator, anaerobic regulatory protein